ncbi:hypothetical protein GCM10010872_28130 [Dyella flava]|nr:hypothetical protein GCM10010872_28130 [Dyella flava]
MSDVPIPSDDNGTSDTSEVSADRLGCNPNDPLTTINSLQESIMATLDLTAPARLRDPALVHSPCFTAALPARRRALSG